MALESEFQAKLREELEAMFPGCIILKNDSGFFPGIPDLIILFENRWAMLEVKKSRTARERPNQGYWVDYLDRMSYAAFIYPENKERILDEISEALRPRRKTFHSKRE